MAWTCGKCKKTHDSFDDAKTCKGTAAASEAGAAAPLAQAETFGRAHVKPYDPQVTAAGAAARRKNPTESEAALAGALADNRLGLVFKREVEQCGFVLDFYCSAAKLAVEVDGSVHRSRREVDRRRDQQLLAERRIRVLRFSASQVLADPAGVAETILRAADTPGTRKRLERRGSAQQNRTPEWPSVLARMEERKLEEFARDRAYEAKRRARASAEIGKALKAKFRCETCGREFVADALPWPTCRKCGDAEGSMRALCKARCGRLMPAGKIGTCTTCRAERQEINEARTEERDDSARHGRHSRGA